MNSNTPHWTFYLEVVLRSLKDLETASAADPLSSEFAFLRSEAPDIASEAQEALLAIERYLQLFETSACERARHPTQH